MVPVGDGCEVTLGFVAIMEACGCKPASCHGCGKPFLVRQRMGICQGHFTHYECRKGPLRFAHSEEERDRIEREIAALGGVVEIMDEAVQAAEEGREPRKSVKPSRERGCFLRPDDFLFFGTGAPGPKRDK